jgi:thiamine biosynthesis lipoprotein ApbE
MKTILILSLAAACSDAGPPPPVSRVWPVLGTMMSAAAWGPDTAGIGRALGAAHDTADRSAPAAFDSLRLEIRRETGIAVAADDIKEGAALDRAALVLGSVADSALLDIGGQFLWVGSRATRRTVGIVDPASSMHALATVELRAGSVSTASHTGDKGNERSVAVTVLAPSGATADAWSTALLGLGCDRALALAPRVAGGGVSLVCADSGGSRVRWTADLEGRVQVLHRP